MGTRKCDWILHVTFVGVYYLNFQALKEERERERELMEEPKWTRVLWKKQPFPDNYVGDSFLRVSKKSKCYNMLVVWYYFI